MHRAPYDGSPVEAISADLSEGTLALVLGRPGVGKTALLVHAALGSLLRSQRVIHVAVRDTVDHVRSHYDELLRQLPIQGGDAQLAERTAERHRMIHSTQGRPLSLERLHQHLRVLAESADFSPQVMVVDGLSDGPNLPEQLEGLSTLAKEQHLRCWVGIDSEAPLAAEHFRKAAVVVRLVPDGPRIRLHRVHGDGEGEPLPIALDPSTLLASDPQVMPMNAAVVAAASDCTLYTGGAAGSEAAFGRTAERWGVREVAFTFEGHRQARTTGRHELTARELAMGDVSLAYVSKRLHRTYNDRGGLIRGVLQTLWHMVSRSRQVFVVGTILADGTVKGGTGWGVELARMWSRDLWVFDLPQARWHRWDSSVSVRGGWIEDQPKITAPHICGTGTRQITGVGEAAIEELFHSSFGPPAS